MEANSVRHSDAEPHVSENPFVKVRIGQPQLWVEAVLAAAAFITLCVVTLSVAPQAAEPDDGAYHASIVAITEGHLATLSTAQARSLASELDDNPAAPPNQWVQVAPGRYMSEKNPGYPFLAAAFQKLGIIRWAPLFFGALACLGLFVGARRWLGAFGGAAAVGLYCSSGAALAFAWRDYMPTFTDASLVAAGSGLLLWAMLATEAESTRRTLVGLAGFLALEAATFVRYTNLTILVCAVMIVLIASRLHAVRLPPSAMPWWLLSVACLGLGVAAFDTVVYGGPLTSGYPRGEVTFSLDAVDPNLHLLPGHLIRAMPVLLLAVASTVCIVIRWMTLHRVPGPTGAVASRDLAVGLGITATWMVIWALYATYTWTTDPTNAMVSDIRFYMPALGPIALLAAWLIKSVPAHRRVTGLLTAAVVALLFIQGIHEFHTMYRAFGVPVHVWP